MKVKKGVLGLGIVALSLGLFSCSVDMPEGEIRDFVNNISYETAYEYVEYGISKVTASHYIDGISDGNISTTTYIENKEKGYYLLDTDLSGIYYGTGVDQFNYNEMSTLIYYENDAIVSSKKTDSVIEDLGYLDDEFKTSIYSFFYTQEESGYHTGGMYYGDDVKMNCGKYYNFFSLNEEKTELTYEINSVSSNEGKEIITMHSFTINEYGMLLKLKTKSFYTETKDTYMETIIECKYNENFEKIYSLE